jgi:DNA (cytosine-5)-methyltransferase 1
MTAYYNEFDPFAAAWLRNLIAAGHIAPGDVDERSIKDVKPSDLRGYAQCHFFAGIGGWSYALRLAGWGDERPVWTGSCPCQPFSTAGKQKGKKDERHLWPVWFNLIRECEPPVIFGEQVSSAINHGWLDETFDDLEEAGFSCGAAVLPACSVGAPHRRDRLWFVADSNNERRDRKHSLQRERWEKIPQATWISEVCTMADTECKQAHKELFRPSENEGEREADVLSGRGLDYEQGVWIDCPDGKQRLVEPSIQLLADGIPNRVGKLRGYGNAIVPQVAAEFIRAGMS